MSGTSIHQRLGGVPILAALLLGEGSAAQSRPPEGEFVLSAERTDGPVTVRFRLLHPPATRLRVAMPAWSPGSYRIQTHARGITGLQARDPDGKTLPLLALDHQTWEVETRGGDGLTVEYQLNLTGRERFARRGSGPRALTLDGPATWLYVADHLRMPYRVRFELPEDWKVATGLPRTEDPRVFAAPDYDVLADCPIKVGALEVLTFESGGKPFEVVIDGPANLRLDRERFVKVIQQITDSQIALMGEAPFPRYVFLFTLNTALAGGGGLEHLNSTSISLPVAMLGRDPAAGASVIAHEFFHLWNVKRVRPQALGPFDYSRDVRTKALWLCEGVTSYYADLTRVRTGLLPEARFWAEMRSQIQQLENHPAHKTMSAETASWTVWDTPPEGGAISYYNKGELLGLLLDLTLRERTGNSRSLDDVMRALYWGLARHGKGFAEDEVRRVAESVAACDLGAFFDRHVAGTVPLPYQETLAYAGMDVAIDRRVRRGLPGVTGMSYATPRPPGRRSGAQSAPASTSAPAAASAPAPLRGRVEAIDGVAVEDEAALAKALEARKVGDVLKVRVKPEDADAREVELKLEESERARVTLEPLEHATEAQLRIRKGLLEGTPRRP